MRAKLAAETFDADRQPWKRWLQRLEGAFHVFHISEDTEKVAYLLHYIGVNAFGILCDQLDPEDPYLKSYDQLKAKLSEFYAPEPLEIAENYIFHRRRQREEENAQQLMVALQKLSIHCKFGSYLQTALRNQFVFGLQNQRIQSRLLEAADLTMEKALKTATTMELADQGVSKLKSDTTLDIHYVGAGKRNFRKGADRDRNPRQTSNTKRGGKQKFSNNIRTTESSKNSSKSANGGI